MSDNPKRHTTRGQFLSLATIGMGGTIAAVIGVPAVAYLAAPVLDKATFRPVPLGDVAEFTAQHGFPPKAAPYVEDPAEPQTSAGLAYVLSTGGKSHHWLDDDAMFVVFSNRCTHVGCPVAPTAVGFSCPCHAGSTTRRPPHRRPADPPAGSVPVGAAPGRQRPEAVDHAAVERRDRQLQGQLLPVRAPGQPIDLPGPEFISEIAYPAVTYSQPAKPTD